MHKEFRIPFKRKGVSLRAKYFTYVGHETIIRALRPEKIKSLGLFL